MSKNHYIRKGLIADTVPYDDDNCPDCKLGDSVQEAIDTLKAFHLPCTLALVRCIPCPGTPTGYMNVGACFLTDQNFCFIKKVVC